MNRTQYDELSYKKYKAFCYLEREELRDENPYADIDFQLLSFGDFVKRLDEDPKFAEVWGYWNFI